MDSEQKWAAFAGIPPECWRQGASIGASDPIWILPDDWREAIFGDEYAALATNGDPNLGPGGVIAFVTALGVHEVRVFSRLRAGCYYDFAWRFDAGPYDADRARPAGDIQSVGDLANRAIVVPRWNNGLESGRANVVWLVNPRQVSTPVRPAEMNLRIYSADIDETIDLNLASLANAPPGERGRAGASHPAVATSPLLDEPPPGYRSRRVQQDPGTIEDLRRRPRRAGARSKR